MDANRFDMLSRSLSRRGSRRGLAAGGIAAGLAALGIERAAAANTCALQIQATTVTGTHKDTIYTGTLNIEIGDNGAIDNGSFNTSDGANHPLVGQATGRALHLRITLGDSQVLALEGTAANDLILCRGEASGTFGGPDDTDLGTWRTVSGQSGSGGSSGTSNASSGSGGGTTNSSSGTTGSGGGGNTSGGGGNTSGGGDNSGGGGGGGGGCASGVVCNGVCCAPAPGLSADNITCNAGACECTYSCASAGCGGGDGSIVNTCGSDPEPHCHSECNVPGDNGCGDMTCNNDETLDVDSCTCIPNGGDCGGADLLHDANNCGFCGVVCGSGFCQNGVCTDSDPCVQTGLTNCNSMCVDTQNDPENCGGCGNHCQSGQCIEGNCTDVVN
jgi:hypothetical protein